VANSISDKNSGVTTILLSTSLLSPSLDETCSELCQTENSLFLTSNERIDEHSVVSGYELSWCFLLGTDWISAKLETLVAHLAYNYQVSALFFALALNDVLES
jgi:hypothetical protein